MKWYFALGLAFIVCGTVMSTAAVPLSEPVDELAPAEDTGVALAPADTPNGDRYASFDSNGELVISVDVFSSTETVFDDVFVVGFAGVTGSDEAATIQIEHDSEWLDIYKNTDSGARESVDEASNTLTLDPGEQATLGFTVTTSADSPSSLSEKVTYTMEIPDAESGTGGGNGGNGDSGSGGSGGDAGGNTGAGGSGGGDTGSSDGGGAGDGDGTDAGNVGGGGTNVSDGGDTGEESTDSPEVATTTDEPAETPAGGESGGGGGVGTLTEGPTETPTDSEEEPETVAGGGAEPVPPTPESQQSAEPSGFTLGFDPAFGVSWGPWAFIAGLLAVVTNYLVQTRYHDVLPVLQTQPSDRRHRFRRVAIREAAIGLAGIVLTILVVSAVSSAGFGPVTQLGAALAFSAAVGTVTGYRLVPELDTMLEPQADDDGTKEQ
ncbi:hypothetical protein [Haloarcula marismortui]|uniref:Uncharacterized protein n=1 Tax=Haloarcula marismortui ATCC 33800 TaxID=662476 RepID=M0JRI4_9EURY|nr:hypothetical protein [Haloarcula sinaiiensis]EMA11757.1 hypothetical protein C436_15778 [Haloarcula sinaiiensis ATCC 33800]QUJ71511.1 hypothetical protein KDQ40_12480 [Haloarcula sinaiiensis ATCC 33800]